VPVLTLVKSATSIAVLLVTIASHYEVPHVSSNPIKTIRERLGVTQAALADALGCTQGNVGHYERGQTVPPDMARRLIQFAAARGHRIGYDDVYGPPLDSAEQGTEVVAAGEG
jgi:putative transcriptional regulator